MASQNLSAELRLQRLEDIEAIRQLKARYFHACDAKDVDAIRTCFSAGKAHIDYGAIGQFSAREDFLAVYQAMACHPTIVDMHHGQNAQIQWDSPEQASAIWDLFFYQINTETGVMTQLAGHYRDRFAKEDGRWVMVETVFKITSCLVSQNEGSAVRLLQAGGAPG
ncbi:MAG TPA: nuclear transport factor 2 family protein [Dongiaceae bacterium]|nr:nuclear transport factor 2 family protein [Dongiaceae bacterium]